MMLKIFSVLLFMLAARLKYMSTDAPKICKYKFPNLVFWLNISNVNLSSFEGDMGPELKEEIPYQISSDQNKKVNTKELNDGYELTKPDKEPYSVIVLTLVPGSDLSGVCTGTLITLKWILTAAHCFSSESVPNFKDVAVVAGAPSVKNVRCSGCQIQRTCHKNVFVHPKYTDKEKVLNDIALVNVPKNFRSSKTVKSMGLLQDPWIIGERKMCKFTGFGRLLLNEHHRDDNARKTRYLEVTSPCKCFDESDYDENIIICNDPQENNGLCRGDSGGGLICNEKLVAIASVIFTFDDIDSCLVLKHGVATECGLRNTISVFVQTYPHLGWIHSYAGAYCVGRHSSLTFLNVLFMFAVHKFIT